MESQYRKFARLLLLFENLLLGNWAAQAEAGLSRCLGQPLLHEPPDSRRCALHRKWPKSSGSKKKKSWPVLKCSVSVAHELRLMPGERIPQLESRVATVPAGFR